MAGVKTFLYVKQQGGWRDAVGWTWRVYIVKGWEELRISFAALVLKLFRVEGYFE